MLSTDPKSDLKVTLNNGSEVWEVPYGANSRYLSHDYFRYIGKFPPQLAREFVRQYSPAGGTVLDPMCGGGTTLIESKIEGRNAIGYDINPVATLVSRVATTGIEPPILEQYVTELVATITQELIGQPSLLLPTPRTAVKSKVNPPDLLGNEEYFDATTLHHLTVLKGYIDAIDRDDVREFCLVAFLSILRQVSRANVKKMNTEIDENKQPREVLPTFTRKLHQMVGINYHVWQWRKVNVTVGLNNAQQLPLSDGSVHLVILHPPYLSNTAFSEAVQLPLAWLGVKHTAIWKQELRCRGSFLKEPDGLQKYLVGWHRILSEAYRVLSGGGFCVAVVGDGQIDYVRIPVGTITAEFAADIGFQQAKRIMHRINNNTGMTLTHRMRHQHILVFQKG